MRLAGPASKLRDGKEVCYTGVWQTGHMSDVRPAWPAGAGLTPVGPWQIRHMADVRPAWLAGNGRLPTVWAGAVGAAAALVGAGVLEAPALVGAGEAALLALWQARHMSEVRPAWLAGMGSMPPVAWHMRHWSEVRPAWSARRAGALLLDVGVAVRTAGTGVVGRPVAGVGL